MYQDVYFKSVLFISVTFMAIAMPALLGGIFWILKICHIYKLFYISSKRSIFFFFSVDRFI